MLLAKLSLALTFASLATAAAIPMAPGVLQKIEPKEAAEWLSPRDALWAPAARSASSDEDGRLNKRMPYYFPETVPDADEIADRLTAMREAGLVTSEQRDQYHNSIGTPDAGIDTRARTMPNRDLMSELDRLEAAESVWEMLPSLLPPMRFFVVASMTIAIFTVIRGCLRARH
ncbi:uncharacterized protein N7482_002787 [Penicillium canariense]|uniref:Uncharacterized protein n=1 Tax=Penicillium canariense TaxID=189055 RepID=A0A9W9IGR1_9EURO|nr:uncharacterized protein N7482_002787 [Penicillium canariense]KAJ5176910.1 hypothetical protein N7482_002787 [Penicillium canariense]